MEPLEIAKQYLEENHPGMQGADLQVDKHDTKLDYNMVNNLQTHGITDDHVSDEDQQIVTASKTITMDDGTEIPKIFKLRIKDNNVQRVIESK